MKITPEQAREALDAWICRPGMTQEQATILITEAFWALKERPNIDVQRVTDEGGAVDQRALGVNRVKIFERWKAIDTRDKREKFTALVQLWRLSGLMISGCIVKLVTEKASRT